MQKKCKDQILAIIGKAKAADKGAKTSKDNYSKLAGAQRAALEQIENLLRDMVD